MTENIIIAIDGPAGAGKSTVAKLIAEKLGLLYIDTGAMYRALTLSVLRQQIDLANETIVNEIMITKLAESLIIELPDSPAENKVLLNGEDVSEAIRNPEISRNVAIIAKIPGVRKTMVNLQKALAKKGRVVMEGRDIGNKVLPGAGYKFFLTASAQERAQRRYIELTNKGYQVDLNELVQEITQRDYIDSTRKSDPLIPAKDAIIIDSTAMNLEQVLDFILSTVYPEKIGGSCQ